MWPFWLKPNPTRKELLLSRGKDPIRLLFRPSFRLMAHLASLLPAPAVVAAWPDLAAALTWAKLPEDLLLSLVKELGEDTLPSMEVLAAVEADEVKTAMTTLAVTAMKKTVSTLS